MKRLENFVKKKFIYTEKNKLLKKLYFIFNVFLVLFIASCSTHVAKKQVDKNIVQKETTRYVTIEWNLNSSIPVSASNKSLVKFSQSNIKIAAIVNAIKL